MQNLEHIPPIMYTLLSCWTRFHQIGKSNVVVWDEAHFGKFGSHYLKREFYFDVHPPLGKMLVGLAGLLSGYDGTFGFESGSTYPDTVPYVAMRVILATFGVALVPLGWYTAVELGMSWMACHLVALMVLCGECALDNLYARIYDADQRPGRCRLVVHIPIHSFGLYVVVLHVHYRLLPRQIPQPTIPVREYPYSDYARSIQLTDTGRSCTHPSRSFSFDWWLWLGLTGYSIGCVCR